MRERGDERAASYNCSGPAGCRGDRECHCAHAHYSGAGNLGTRRRRGSLETGDAASHRFVQGARRPRQAADLGRGCAPCRRGCDVGRQSTRYPSMYRLMRGEDPGPPAAAATLAAGIAVKEPGQLTRRIVKALVSDILLVDDVTIERAIEVLLERQKLVVEGAGAAGLAAVLAAPERFRGRRVGIVICGGNIDARLLASILMRGLVHAGRLVRLRSELPDIPSALSRLSGVIGKHSGNIVEVHHQRLFHDTSVKRAELDVVVETQNRRHVEVLIAALIAAGFPTHLLPNGGFDGEEP